MRRTFERRTLRIAFYSVSGPGGSMVSSMTLLGGLREEHRGHRDRLTTRPDRPARGGSSRHHDPGACRPWPTSSTPSPFLATSPPFAGLRPDVLHVSCDNPWTSPYGLLAGLLTRTPTIATVHGPAPAWRRRQQWLVRRIAPSVAAYVSVSMASSRATESALGLPPGSVRTIYNGVSSLCRCPAPHRSRRNPSSGRSLASPQKRGSMCSLRPSTACDAVGSSSSATARSGRASKPWSRTGG